MPSRPVSGSYRSPRRCATSPPGRVVAGGAGARLDGGLPRSHRSGIARADVSALGLQRERFKRERGDVRDALTAAVALAPGASGWERVISERIFGQSKRLAAVRALVLEILLRADPAGTASRARTRVTCWRRTGYGERPD